MYKIIVVLLSTIILFGCSKASREATVDRVSYEHSEMTVLFKDGIVITTSNYDSGIKPGDTVYVTHKGNGDVIIKK